MYQLIITHDGALLLRLTRVHTGDILVIGLGLGGTGQRRRRGRGQYAQTLAVAVTEVRAAILLHVAVVLDRQHLHVAHLGHLTALMGPR